MCPRQRNFESNVPWRKRRHPDSPTPRQRDRALRLGGAGRARRGPRVPPRLSRARPHRLRPPRRHAGPRRAGPARQPRPRPRRARPRPPRPASARRRGLQLLRRRPAARARARCPTSHPTPSPRRPRSERPRQPSPARGHPNHADRRDRRAARRSPRRSCRRRPRRRRRPRARSPTGCNGAIALRYADRAAAARRAEGKDTGTVRLDDGEVTVIADLPKKVDWDQAELGDDGRAHPRRRRRPGRVRRDDVPGLRAQVRRLAARRSATASSAARTVKPGKPTFRLTLREER